MIRFVLLFALLASGCASARYDDCAAGREDGRVLKRTVCLPLTDSQKAKGLKLYRLEEIKDTQNEKVQGRGSLSESRSAR